ncbi:MAG: hypothetical protein ABIJ14_01805 [Nanoarchaeota archaeon]
MNEQIENCENGECKSRRCIWECNDNVGCTTDRCVNGFCTYKTNDVFCDDGNVCNGKESCQEVGCGHGCVSIEEPLNCDDGNACTIDSCDSETGCQYEEVNCDDRISCTIDSCNSIFGCQNIPVDSFCESGEKCTPYLGCEQTTCKGCEDCDNWFDLFSGGCTKQKCVNDCSEGSGCYYRGKILLGEDCVLKDNFCKDIEKCEDYSTKECKNPDVCSISDTGCVIKNNQCVKRTVQCTPSCFGKQCGDDGCGNSCGECGEDVCESGSCVTKNFGFPSGTQVLMDDNSYKNIEEIQVGDKVLSLNEETNEKVSGTVLETIKKPGIKSMKIVFEGDSSLTAAIGVSIYTEKGWRKISTGTDYSVLKIDDKVIFDEDKKVVKEILELDEISEIYHLITDIHNYYVYVASAVVVHDPTEVCYANCAGACGDDGCGGSCGSCPADAPVCSAGKCVVTGGDCRWTTGRICEYSETLLEAFPRDIHYWNGLFSLGGRSCYYPRGYGGGRKSPPFVDFSCYYRLQAGQSTFPTGFSGLAIKKIESNEVNTGITGLVIEDTGGSDTGGGSEGSGGDTGGDDSGTSGDLEEFELSTKTKDYLKTFTVGHNVVLESGKPISKGELFFTKVIGFKEQSWVFNGIDADGNIIIKGGRYSGPLTLNSGKKVTMTNNGDSITVDWGGKLVDSDKQVGTLCNVGKVLPWGGKVETFVKGECYETDMVCRAGINPEVYLTNLETSACESSDCATPCHTVDRITGALTFNGCCLAHENYDSTLGKCVPKPSECGPCEEMRYDPFEKGGGIPNERGGRCFPKYDSNSCMTCDPNNGLTEYQPQNCPTTTGCYKRRSCKVFAGCYSGEKYQWGCKDPVFERGEDEIYEYQGLIDIMPTWNFVCCNMYKQEYEDVPQPTDAPWHNFVEPTCSSSSSSQNNTSKQGNQEDPDAGSTKYTTSDFSGPAQLYGLGPIIYNNECDGNGNIQGPLTKEVIGCLGNKRTKSIYGSCRWSQNRWPYSIFSSFDLIKTVIEEDCGTCSVCEETSHEETVELEGPGQYISCNTKKKYNITIVDSTQCVPKPNTVVCNGKYNDREFVPQEQEGAFLDTEYWCDGKGICEPKFHANIINLEEKFFPEEPEITDCSIEEGECFNPGCEITAIGQPADCLTPTTTERSSEEKECVDNLDNICITENNALSSITGFSIENIEYPEEQPIIKRRKELENNVLIAKERKEPLEIIENLELEVVKFDNSQDILENQGDLASIKNAIFSIEQHIYNNPKLQPLVKMIAYEDLADLHFWKASKILEDIPFTTSFKILRESEEIILPSAAGCITHKYPEIKIQAQLDRTFNEEGKLITSEKKVIGWETPTGDLKDICDFKGLNEGYYSLFKQLCMNDGKYSILTDFLSINKNFKMSGKSFEEIGEYQNAIKEYEKAIEYLEESKAYFQTRAMKELPKGETRDVYKYREVTYKLSRYYYAMERYLDTIKTINSMFIYSADLNYPMNDKFLSNIYFQQGMAYYKLKELKEALKYSERSIKADPENLDADTFHKTMQKNILERIDIGTSNRMQKIFDSSHEFTAFWWYLVRDVSLQASTETVLKDIENAQIETAKRKVAIRFLTWALEEGISLETFYYDEVDLPEEIYIEKDGKRVINKDYIIDYGESFTMITPEGNTEPTGQVYAFYGKKRRPLTEFGGNGENAEYLPINPRTLYEYTNEHMQHRQKIKEIIQEITDKKVSDLLIASDYANVDLVQSSIERLIRTNPDIALVAANGDTTRELELLYKMGVYKHGTSIIKKERIQSVLVPGIGYMENYVTPEEHSPTRWMGYEVPRLVNSDFIFKDGNHPLYKELYEYTPIFHTWKDFFAGFVNVVDVGLIAIGVIVVKPVQIYYNGLRMTTTNFGSAIFAVAGRTQSTLPLKMLFYWTKADRAVRSTILTWTGLRYAPGWVVGTLRTGSYIGVGGTAIITATSIHPALYIPTAMVVDVMLGGAHVHGRMIPGIKGVLGVEAKMSQAFIRNRRGISEIVHMIEIPASSMDNVGEYLQQQGLRKKWFSMQLPTNQGIKKFQNIYVKGNNLFILVTPYGPRVVGVTGILSHDIMLLNSQAYTDEIMKILKDAPKDISDMALRKKVLDYVYAKKSLQDIMSDVAGKGPNFDGTFVVGKLIADGIDIPLTGIDYNLNPLTGHFHEILDKNGRIISKFREKEIFVVVKENGEMLFSLNEAGIAKQVEHGEKVRAWGMLKSDSSGNIKEFVPREYNKGAVKKYQEVVANKAARANGYFGEPTLALDKKLSPSLIRAIEKGEAVRRPIEYFTDINTGMSISKEWIRDYEGRIILESGKAIDEDLIKSLKDGVAYDYKGTVLGKPKEQLYVSYEGSNKVGFDHHLHQRVWKDGERVKFVDPNLDSKGKLKYFLTDSLVYGLPDETGRTSQGPYAREVRMVLFEREISGARLTFVATMSDVGTEILRYNPLKHGRRIYDFETGIVYVEHNGRLVQGAVFDTRNNRVVYKDPETGKYLVRWEGYENPEPLSAKYLIVNPEFPEIGTEVLVDRIFYDDNTGRAFVAFEHEDGTVELIEGIYSHLGNTFDDESQFPGFRYGLRTGQDVVVFQHPNTMEWMMHTSKTPLFREAEIYSSQIHGRPISLTSELLESMGKPPFFYNKRTGDSIFFDDMGELHRGFLFVAYPRQTEFSAMVVYNDPDIGYAIGVWRKDTGEFMAVTPYDPRMSHIRDFQDRFSMQERRIIFDEFGNVIHAEGVWLGGGVGAAIPESGQPRMQFGPVIPRYKRYAREAGLTYDPAKWRSYQEFERQRWIDTYHGDGHGETGAFKTFEQTGLRMIEDEGFTWVGRMDHSEYAHMFSVVEADGFIKRVILSLNPQTGVISRELAHPLYSFERNVKNFEEMVNLIEVLKTKGYTLEEYGEDGLSAVVNLEVTVMGRPLTRRNLIQIGVSRFEPREQALLNDIPLTELWLRNFIKSPDTLQRTSVPKITSFETEKGIVKIFNAKREKTFEMPVRITRLGDEIQIYKVSDDGQWLYPISRKTTTRNRLTETQLSYVKGEKIGKELVTETNAPLEDGGFILVTDEAGKPMGGMDNWDFASEMKSYGTRERFTPRLIDGPFTGNEYLRNWRGLNPREILKQEIGFGRSQDKIIFTGLSEDRAIILRNDERMFVAMNPRNKDELVAVIPDSESDALTIIRNYQSSDLARPQSHYYLKKGNFKGRIKGVGEEIEIFWNEQLGRWGAKVRGQEIDHNSADHGVFFIDEGKRMFVHLDGNRKNYGEIRPRYYDIEIYDLEKGYLIFTNYEGEQRFYRTGEVQSTSTSIIKNNPKKYQSELSDPVTGAHASYNMETAKFDIVGGGVGEEFYPEGVVLGKPGVINSEEHTTNYWAFENMQTQESVRLVRENYVLETEYNPGIFKKSLEQIKKETQSEETRILIIDDQAITEQKIVGKTTNTYDEDGAIKDFDVDVKTEELEGGIAEGLRVISVIEGNKEIFVHYETGWQVIIKDGQIKFITSEGRIISPGDSGYPIKQNVRNLGEEGMRLHIEKEKIHLKPELLKVTMTTDAILEKGINPNNLIIDLTDVSIRHIDDDSEKIIEDLLALTIKAESVGGQVHSKGMSFRLTLARRDVLSTIDSKGVMRLYDKRTGERLIFYEQRLYRIDREGQLWEIYTMASSEHLESKHIVLTSEYSMLSLRNKKGNTIVSPTKLSEILGIPHIEKIVVKKQTFAELITQKYKQLSRQGAEGLQRLRNTGIFVKGFYETGRVGDKIYQKRGLLLLSRLTEEKIATSDGNAITFATHAISKYNKKDPLVPKLTASGFDSDLSTSIEHLFGYRTVEIGRLGGEFEKSYDLASLIYRIAEAKQTLHDRLVIVTNRRDAEKYIKNSFKETSKNLLDLFDELNIPQQQRQDFLDLNGLVTTEQLKTDRQYIPYLARWKAQGIDLDAPEHQGRLWLGIIPEKVYDEMGAMGLGKHSVKDLRAEVNRLGTGPVILEAEVNIINLQEGGMKKLEEFIKRRAGLEQ